MLLACEKLGKRLNELRECRYKDIHRIENFRSREDKLGCSNPMVPHLSEEDVPFCMGDTWRGRDKYIWLETTLNIPQEWKNVGLEWEPVLIFDFCGWDCEFEAMLYINGEPYQGVDAQHAEVFLKEEHIGQELVITLRLWSGLERGGIPKELCHQYRDARLCLLNISTDSLYSTGSVVLSTVEILQEEQEERIDLLTALEDSLMLIEWTNKGSDVFYKTVKSAELYLLDQIDKMDKNTRITIHCVGHTHIDTAWLWQLKHTREKTSRSFSTVLRLMERFPEYSFLHTQPQQYAFLKEDFPQIYEQIQQRVQEGRWEIDGAMWVEPDCNLISGESFTRQILMGRKFILEEFGKECTFLWLPDAFGYSPALPQVLKKSGIHTFMTAKLTWSQYNDMPNNTFWWQGLDGTKILTYLLSTPNPYIYNGVMEPKVITDVWKRYSDKAFNKNVMMTYGYGDGGGGVSREMLEKRRIMDRLPGLPNVKTSSAREFFEQLHDTVEQTNKPIATWDGELYLEYHRGTFTSQAYNKRMNRFLENLYRKAEWLTAIAAINFGDISMAEQERLTEGWKLILTQQFHDIIPGSSIREVYEDSVICYQKAEQIANEVIDAAYDNANTYEETDSIICIFNPDAEERGGMVRIADNTQSHIYLGKALFEKDGHQVSLQMGQDGIWAYVDKIPAMGIKHLYVKEAGKEVNEVCCASVNQDYKKTRLVTPYYDIELNEVGQISHLYDRTKEWQVLEKGECGNVLQLFEDKPLDYDAWDIDMFYYQKKQEVTNLVNRRIVENGPLRTVVRQEWNVNNSTICQDMILYANSARIDFKTHINWQETQKLLKVAFPVDIRSTYASYDVAYGNIKRPTNSNTSWERAKFEVVGHRWADLSEHDYGVSLLNDCKYGYDIHENVMRLSLLKAAIYPDYAADKGEHEFVYSLYPHKGDFVLGNTVREATDLNRPLEAVSRNIAFLNLTNGSAVRLSGAYVELDALKKSEDGKYLVLRFHEYAGSKGKVKMKFGFTVKGICECDLMERPMENFYTSNSWETSIKAYEIKTFLIEV